MPKRHNCSSCAHWQWSTGEDIGRCARSEGPAEGATGVVVRTLKGSWLTGCGAKCSAHEKHPVYGNFEEGGNG